MAEIKMMQILQNHSLLYYSPISKSRTLKWVFEQMNKSSAHQANAPEFRISTHQSNFPNRTRASAHLHWIQEHGSITISYQSRSPQPAHQSERLEHPKQPSSIPEVSAQSPTQQCHRIPASKSKTPQSVRRSQMDKYRKSALLMKLIKSLYKCRYMLSNLKKSDLKIKNLKFK